MRRLGIGRIRSEHAMQTFASKPKRVSARVDASRTWNIFAVAGEEAADGHVVPPHNHRMYREHGLKFEPH